MKVKLLSGMSGQRDGVGFSYAPGDVYECDDEEAARLMERGLAEPTGGPQKRKATKPEPQAE